MLASWNKVTSQALADGLVAEAPAFPTVGNQVTEQAAQIQTLILQGYDAIVIDLSSPFAVSYMGLKLMLRYAVPTALAMMIMDGSIAMLPVGIAVSLGTGLGVGLFNYILIRLRRIPPTIAMLSSSFLTLSTAIAGGRALKIKPPPMLTEFTTAPVLGGPILAAVIILFAALFLFLLATMFDTFGARAGIRLIMTGVIIVAAITIAGSDKPRRWRGGNGPGRRFRRIPRQSFL